MQDVEADPMIWFALVRGPPGTPYEGGIFKLKITIPEDYPTKVPKVEFLTPIFHPNVQNGNICLDILDESQSLWSPKLRIETLVMAVCQMMEDSKAEGGFEEVSKLMLRDRKKWFAQAKAMTREHAMPWDEKECVLEKNVRSCKHIVRCWGGSILKF